MRLAEGGDRRSESYEKKQGLANLSKVENPINVRAKLAETAGVSERTYSMGKKILDSNNEEVKQKVMSGEMSINAGYNKIIVTRKQSISFQFLLNFHFGKQNIVSVKQIKIITQGRNALLQQ